MTKEEFKSKKEIINSKINELNNEMVKGVSDKVLCLGVTSNE